MESVFYPDAGALLLVFPGCDRLKRREEIIHAGLTGQSSLCGCFFDVARNPQTFFQVTCGDILQKFFRADPGPFGEYPLKMLRTKVYLFRDLAQLRLMLKILLQVLNGLFNTLVIDMVLLCCQNHKSIIYDSKMSAIPSILNPKLADNQLRAIDKYSLDLFAQILTL